MHTPQHLRSLCALALATLLGAGTAQAGYVDTATSLEWRQLTETVGTTWNTAATQCNTSTGLCNGDWAGWTWASMTDVRVLFQNLGIPVSAATPDVTENGATWANAAIDRDGAGPDTGAFDATSITALYAAINGIVRDPVENGFVRFAGVVDFFESGTAYAASSPLLATQPDAANGTIGIFLYRAVDLPPGNEVPEPGTAALLGLGAAGLLAWRGRRRAGPQPLHSAGER